MANCQVWQRPAALASRSAILELEMGHMGRMRIGLVTGVINSADARFGAAVTDVESPRRGLVIGNCRCGHAQALLPGHCYRGVPSLSSALLRRRARSRFGAALRLRSVLALDCARLRSFALGVALSCARLRSFALVCARYLRSFALSCTRLRSVLALVCAQLCSVAFVCAQKLAPTASCVAVLSVCSHYLGVSFAPSS